MSRLLLATAAFALALAAPAAARYQPPPVDFAMTPPASAIHAAAAGGMTTGVLRPAKRFNVVGISWRGRVVPIVHIRAHVAGGHWSPWQKLGTSADHDPDPSSGEATARSVSDPAWAGDADAVQLRLSRRVAGLRVHFVNVLGTATAADRARRSRHRAAAARAPAIVRPAGGPAIVPRSGWDAAACGPPRAAPAYGEVKIAIVHHTESLNGYSPSQSPSIVLGICRFHRDTRGWNDIGYNFLVDRYGTIFEGRAGGIDLPVSGAQAGGFNDQSTGIAVIGNTVSTPATQASLRSIAALIRWKLPLEGVPTTGRTEVTSRGGPDSHWRAGVTVTENRISGHRDVDSTDCPGGALYAQLPGLRRMVGDVGPDPALAPTTLSLAADPPLVRVPGQTLLHGVLAGGGAPAAGAQVVVRAWRGSGWRVLAHAVTDSNGAYAVAYAARRGDVVDAFYAGDPAHRRSVSPAAFVRARPAMSLSASAATVAPGAPLRLGGSIAPGKGRVGLVIERQSGGHYVRISTARVRTRGGRFSRTLRLPKPGAYRAYARFAGDSLNSPSRSPAVAWTVR